MCFFIFVIQTPNTPLCLHLSKLLFWKQKEKSNRMALHFQVRLNRWGSALTLCSLHSDCRKWAALIIPSSLAASDCLLQSMTLAYLTHVCFRNVCFCYMCTMHIVCVSVCVCDSNIAWTRHLLTLFSVKLLPGALVMGKEAHREEELLTC